MDTNDYWLYFCLNIRIVKKKFLFILLLFFTVSKKAIAQRWNNGWGGVQVGVMLNIGTHVNAIGIQTKAYVGTSWSQLNIGNTISFNLTSYGKRKFFWENRSYLGGALMFGPNKIVPDFELDGLNHQSNRLFAVAYNYLYYWDNAKTSQASGAFALHLEQLSLRMENDVFAGQARDRFRTGHFHISYRWDMWRFGIGGYMWTGETRNSPWNKTPQHKMPSGYRDLSDLPYGKTSHGIIYLSTTYNLPYGNPLFVRVGWDSEQIRHGIQNRAFHDLAGMPKNWKRNTPHYPRLDADGCPVFEKKERKKDTFFFQIGAHDNWGN